MLTFPYFLNDPPSSPSSSQFLPPTLAFHSLPLTPIPPLVFHHLFPILFLLLRPSHPLPSISSPPLKWNTLPGFHPPPPSPLRLRTLSIPFSLLSTTSPLFFLLSLPQYFSFFIFSSFSLSLLLPPLSPFSAISPPPSSNFSSSFSVFPSLSFSSSCCSSCAQLAYSSGYDDPSIMQVEEEAGRVSFLVAADNYHQMKR